MKAVLRRHPLITSVASVIGLIALVTYVQLQRPVPRISVTQTFPSNLSSGDPAPTVAWPSIGSAAVGIADVGPIGANRDDRPRSIASLTKVMTAYVALKDHPLNGNETGPGVDIQAADVDTYRKQLAQGESVVEVRAGTPLTELELLEGLLIPSGNNLAFVLANWSSGSVEAFVARMNEEAAALGMKATKYADPSGASPANASTARDQLLLAQAAMADPVFARIVGLKQAVLPVAGVVYNVNSLVGKDGLVGIKTGWTEEAGACFMFARDWDSGGQLVRIYGVVLGQDTLADAFAATSSIVGSVGPSLGVEQVVRKDDPAANLRAPWAPSVSASPAEDVSFVLWSGLPVDTKFEAAPKTSHLKDGDQVGTMVVTAGNQQREVALIAHGEIPRARLSWRLTRLLW